MAAASFLQPSFLGGEVSKSIQGRFDDERYRTWMQVCLNALPMEEGAWTRRPGTMHCGPTRNGRPGRVVGFNFKQTSPYTLEFTSAFLRFRDGPQLVTSNDDLFINTISTATPAKVATFLPHNWTTGQQIMFRGLGINNAPLQNRQFAIVVTSATEFTLFDAVSMLPVDGTTIGTYVSGFAMRIYEIATPYIGDQWQIVRSVQCDLPVPNGITPGTFLLQPTIKPYLLQVVTPPTEVKHATFSFAPAILKDGPYFDPVPGGTQATPSALQGNIQLTLSFNAYDATKSYSAGDYVVDVGINYKSLTDANLAHTPASSPTFWVPVSASDAIGPNGFVGTDIGRHVRLFSEPLIWDKVTAYNKDAVVAYGGTGNQYIGATYWISLVAANTNNIPGADLTKWAIFPNGARWTWGRITGLSNIIDRALAGSSSIGDLTGGGGLAVMFDGNLNQTQAQSASKNVAANPGFPSPSALELRGYGGKNYGATPQKVASVTVYGSTDRGVAGGFYAFGLTTPIVTTITVNLRGKATAPANAADGTLLGSFGPAPATLSPISITSSDATTAWNFVWVEIIAGGTVTGAFTFTIAVAELSFFAPAGTGTSSGVTVQIVGDPLLYTTPIRVWRLGAYSDTTGWPSAGTWHEGRLWLTGVVANRIDSSMSNKPLEFSPTNPDGSISGNNGISYTFNSPDVNPIFWMMPDREGIVCGTQSGEWLVQATSANVPLTPTTIQAHRMTTYNCADIEPRRTNNTIAVVQAFKRDLLEFFADVYAGKFVAHDIALTAKHLVKSGLQEIGYQQEVVPNIWARLGDGSLRGVVYGRSSLVSANPPQNAAWHRHELGSGRLVESLCIGANSDGTLDALMMVTNDDSAVRHVEMLTTVFLEVDDPVNAWFLDNATAPSSTTINASPSPGAPYGGLVINGLWHLNGKTVQVYAGGLDCGQIEGGAISDFVVSNGSVFVPYGDGVSAGSGQGKFTAAVNAPIVVGFTYTSDGQIVRPNSAQETGARNGPALGKLRRVQQYSIMTIKTAGLSIGTRFDKMDPVLFNAEGAEPMAFGQVFTGIYRSSLQDDNDFDGALCWRITRPQPATICTIGWHIHTQDI